ncbi:ribonuclease HII [Viridibacillus arvi]|uniref:ribonuclease HII n=1 Tax=Viridibacillus arvi TaxID=263475 RepID=UPI0034D01253
MKSIKQIQKEYKLLTENEKSSWLEELKNDNRKGVQQYLSKLQKERVQESKWRKQYALMTAYENQLFAEDIKYIAGIDEVGRGALAGPVVSGCVILPKDCYIPRLNDSKKVSPKLRDELYDEIMEKAIAVSIGVVEASEIDEINILQGTKKSMIQAVQKLKVIPEHLLIDALELDIAIPQYGIIEGDSCSVSIAAASIIAKVTRDRMMIKLHEVYPDYGFNQHVGYGTKQHIQAIEEYGICIQHRKTFSPIKEMVRDFY